MLYALNLLRLQVRANSPERAARWEESGRIWPVMGSVIPDPVLEEESGETAGPPSAPREGDRLEPEPVEPGEVVGTPVNCNEEIKVIKTTQANIA